MATLNDLQRYRNALWEALGGGVRRIRDANGEEVTFGSTDDIRRAIALVEHQIHSLAAPRPAISYPQTSKGL